MATAKLFRNIDTETFTDKWGGVEYSFQPGDSSFFEEGIADKFANVLISKMLMRELPDNQMSAINTHWKREEYMKKIFGQSAPIQGKDSTELLRKISNVDAPAPVAPTPVPEVAPVAPAPVEEEYNPLEVNVINQDSVSPAPEVLDEPVVLKRKAKPTNETSN